MPSNDNALGLYVSIPFCRSKCTYCNFASGVYPASEHGRYVDRLIEDLAGAGEWAARMGLQLPRRVDTVYLGGGTPSLLAPSLLVRLFAAMRADFDFDADVEITVECAPGQILDETLATLVAAGVNRVSLGVQSFIDREAAVSGRLHNRATVFDDLRRLRAAGVANISLDLIAGLAGQTFASWDESLTALIDCEVPHASVYMLEVDEDSRLGREMLSGGARYHAGLVPVDDAIARMYSTAIDRLATAGLAQYEISNFARPGFESRHNLRYWQRRPYLGLGLDASSMLRESRVQGVGMESHELVGQGSSPDIWEQKSIRALAPETCASGDPAKSVCPAVLRAERVVRLTTTSDLVGYLAGCEPVETDWLTVSRQQEEAWFLGLRLNAGVDIADMKREFGSEMVAPALEIVARLRDDCLLTSTGNTVQLTPRGQMISNDVFQEFLGLEPQLALQTQTR
jgi:oxygen-independent coproporphyrinogen-3 oxidase